MTMPTVPASTDRAWWRSFLANGANQVELSMRAESIAPTAASSRSSKSTSEA